MSVQRQLPYHIFSHNDVYLRFSYLQSRIHRFKYKNIKIKVMKTNLQIRFNKTFMKNIMISNYALIKINNNFKAARKLKERAEMIWVNLCKIYLMSYN